MKERYGADIEAGNSLYQLRYSSRDLRFLGGPLLPEAEDFLQALGLWDNYRVATGMNTEAWTSRPRATLMEAATELLNKIRTDREVLGYQYQYAFPADGNSRASGGQAGFKVDGQDAYIDARPPGQLYLSFTSPTEPSATHEIRVRDIRRERSIMTDWGELKVYRRKMPLTWLEKLPGLIGFLARQSCRELRIRHHYVH